MSTPKRQLTLDPLSYATPLETPPEFMRLPKARQRDPLFGLSRGFLNTLILPRRDNQYRLPVVSCVLRQRGARTGVRLINVDSLRQYILRNLEPNSGQPAPVDETNLAAGI